MKVIFNVSPIVINAVNITEELLLPCFMLPFGRVRLITIVGTILNLMRASNATSNCKNL